MPVGSELGLKGRRGCGNLGWPAPRRGGVGIVCPRRDRDLQCLILALQGFELLAHGGVRNFGSLGSTGSPSWDIAEPGSPGSSGIGVLVGPVSPVSTALRLGSLDPRRDVALRACVLGKGCFALAGVAPIGDRDVQSSQSTPERIQGAPDSGDFELEDDFNF